MNMLDVEHDLNTTQEALRRQQPHPPGTGIHKRMVPATKLKPPAILHHLGVFLTAQRFETSSSILTWHHLKGRTLRGVVKEVQEGPDCPLHPTVLEAQPSVT